MICKLLLRTQRYDNHHFIIVSRAYLQQSIPMVRICTLVTSSSASRTIVLLDSSEMIALVSIFVSHMINITTCMYYNFASRRTLVAVTNHSVHLVVGSVELCISLMCG
jgi:hypothetical protein